MCGVHSMNRISSDDAEIGYTVLGNGPALILLHAFPATHELWLPAAQFLLTRYRVIIPDLRGHGASSAGQGVATMTKHATDVMKICEAQRIERAVFAGISIGGYILFELWRRYRERVAALILCNTRAQPDTPEARAARLRSAEDVLGRGTEPFVESMIPKLLGNTTRETRPDLVDAARRMMLKMLPKSLSQVQQGLAERQDSVPTLKTINVPTLVLAGDEDQIATLSDAELMRSNIPGAQIRVLPRAGHYGIFEQYENAGKLIREFVDTLPRN